MSPRTTTNRSTRLRVVPPPPTDEASWKRLLNLLYLLEEDSLFLWVQHVRATLEKVEREKRKAA